MSDVWLKQSNDKPLFPDVLWSRPESKHGAGKLCIIGGNQFAFGAPGIAYNEAIDAKAGIVRVLLPEAIKKTVKAILPDADYANSNRSGSFSKEALSEILSHANWSDLTLLAGDLGRNSETAIMLENFVAKYQGPLTVTQDAVDYFKETPKLITNREQTLIVLSLAQLQRIFIATPTITPITYSMNTNQLVDALSDFTKNHKACIAVKHNDLIFVAFNGRVSTTQAKDEIWRVKTAARASVFYMQNPDKILESVSTALIDESEKW